MNATMLQQLIDLRAAVGTLGEAMGWWPSQFSSESARLSMQRLFPKTAQRALLASVTKAAQLRHDAQVMGHSYHLFRLPEQLEEELEHALESGGPALPDATDDGAAAMKALERLASRATADLGAGPVCLGSAKRLSSTAGLRELAAAYLSAARQQREVVPYFEAEANG